MKIGAPKELFEGEARVALSPQSAKQLQKLGYDVIVEAGAGAKSRFTDAAYAEAGVEVLPDAASFYAAADIVLKVRAPEGAELDQLRSGQTLISFIWPAQNEELLNTLKYKGVTALALDMVPRISRAQ